MEPYLGLNSREKRRHPRLNSRIPVSYRKLETDAAVFKGSLMQDISESGARITINEFLPLDSKLSLQIHLASGRSFAQGACRVAWVRKAAFSEQYHIGVEFAAFSQEDEAQIARFILHNSIETI